MKYNVTVVGAGYVGLSLAILLAKDYNVVLLDIIQDKVDMINNKISPIKDEYIEDYLKNKPLSLKATLNTEEAYKNANFVVIATPTDYDPETNSFNTTNVEEVIFNASKRCPDATIIIKSTIPIGFVKRMREKYGISNLLFSPEFLREGKALYDCLYPSRIIVGVDKDDSDKVKADAEMFGNMLKFSAEKDHTPVIITGIDEAEAIKLFANTYLAGRVSFFNELDTYAAVNDLCAKDIIEGISLDPRIGEGYNNPSFGYGGYCLPKDTKQLLSNYGDIPQNMIKAIVDSNSTRKNFIVNEILKKAKNNLFPAIGFYRLAMKAGSDNSRSSAIKDIIDSVHALGSYSIVLYEPGIKEDTYLGCSVVNDLEKFKNGCELIIANRIDEDIQDVKDKVYTRDIYSTD